MRGWLQLQRAAMDVDALPSQISTSLDDVFDREKVVVSRKKLSQTAEQPEPHVKADINRNGMLSKSDISSCRLYNWYTGLPMEINSFKWNFLSDYLIEKFRLLFWPSSTGCFLHICLIIDIWGTWLNPVTCLIIIRTMALFWNKCILFIVRDIFMKWIISTARKKSYKQTKLGKYICLQFCKQCVSFKRFN